GRGGGVMQWDHFVFFVSPPFARYPTVFIRRGTREYLQAFSSQILPKTGSSTTSSSEGRRIFLISIFFLNASSSTTSSSMSGSSKYQWTIVANAMKRMKMATNGMDCRSLKGKEGVRYSKIYISIPLWLFLLDSSFPLNGYSKVA
ncbi:hypothetical protein PMAYCL1PPCAC_18411, partial [Pristionchus mayeri]